MPLVLSQLFQCNCCEPHGSGQLPVETGVLLCIRHCSVSCETVVLDGCKSITGILTGHSDVNQQVHGGSGAGSGVLGLPAVRESAVASSGELLCAGGCRVGWFGNFCKQWCFKLALPSRALE